MPDQPAPPCLICEFVASTPTPAAVYKDDRWFAGVLGGADVPGWIVLALRRHALGPTAMTDAEAASFGPLVLDLTTAIEAALGSKRVYVQTWGEKAHHLHFLLASRGAEVPPEHRHTKFWDNREKYINPPAAEAAAARVRAALEHASSPAAEEVA